MHKFHDQDQVVMPEDNTKIDGLSILSWPTLSLFNMQQNTTRVALGTDITEKIVQASIMYRILYQCRPHRFIMESQKNCFTF